MDTSTTQFDIDRYENALDGAPASVRQFLWSDTYKQMVAALATHFSLTAAAQQTLSDLIFDIVIAYAPEETVKATLATLGIDQEKQDDLLIYIYEYFVRPMGESEELQAEIEKNELGTEAVPTSTQPATPSVFDALKNRLAEASTIAPAARQLQSGTPVSKPAVTNITKPAATPKPSFDPYREKPDTH